MHELSVCQALVGQLEDLARREEAQRITSVLLRIGPLSGVEPDLLVHSFPLAAAGSVAEGAALTVEEAGVRVRCGVCGAETEARASRLLCGECGDFHTELVAGDELLLARVELERARASA